MTLFCVDTKSLSEKKLKKIDEYIKLLPADFLNSPYIQDSKDRCSDNYYLLCLQELYLIFEDQEIWGYLWEYCFVVAKRCIKKMVYSRKLIFTEDEIIDASIGACTYLLRRYKGGGWQKNKQYKIKNYYVSAIKSACLNALFYRSKTTAFLDDAVKIDAYKKHDLDSFFKQNKENQNPYSEIKAKIKVNVKRFQNSDRFKAIMKAGKHSLDISKIEKKIATQGFTKEASK